MPVHFQATPAGEETDAGGALTHTGPQLRSPVRQLSDSGEGGWLQHIHLVGSAQKKPDVQGPQAAHFHHGDVLRLDGLQHAREEGVQAPDPAARRQEINSFLERLKMPKFMVSANQTHVTLGWADPKNYRSFLTNKGVPDPKENEEERRKAEMNNFLFFLQSLHKQK